MNNRVFTPSKPIGNYYNPSKGQPKGYRSPYELLTVVKINKCLQGLRRLERYEVFITDHNNSLNFDDKLSIIF